MCVLGGNVAAAGAAFVSIIVSFFSAFASILGGATLDGYDVNGVAATLAAR